VDTEGKDSCAHIISPMGLLDAFIVKLTARQNENVGFDFRVKFRRKRRQKKRHFGGF